MIDYIKKLYQDKLNNYNIAVGQKKALEQQLSESQIKISEINNKVELYKKCTMFLQYCFDLIRDKVKYNIELLVTQALSEIMEEDYKFKINFQISRNMLEADFLIVNKIGNEEIEFDPAEDKGGGICDIVSLALRIILLELYYPRIEGPIIFDEVGKHISEEYKDNVGKFLSTVSKKIGRQIIFVTHEKRFLEYADNVIMIKKD